MLTSFSHTASVCSVTSSMDCGGSNLGRAIIPSEGSGARRNKIAVLRGCGLLSSMETGLGAVPLPGVRRLLVESRTKRQKRTHACMSTLRF
jgi:hypothetical protein